MQFYETNNTQPTWCDVKIERESLTHILSKVTNSPLTEKPEVDGSDLKFHFQDLSPNLWNTLHVTENSLLNGDSIDMQQ